MTLLAEGPRDALSRLGLDPHDAIASPTHDPKIDDQALVALKASCFQIGALGSRKTHARRLERMKAEEFGDNGLSRDDAPISPAEIAVFVLGEIVSTPRGKPKRTETPRAERLGTSA